MSNLNRFLSKWSILPEYQDAGLVIDPSKLSREQYQKLYDEGRIATYDNEAGVYQPPVLPEVSISAKAPKSISDFGNRYRKQLQEDNDSLLASMFKLPVEAVMNLPQASFTYLLDSEKNLLPSKALDIENPVGAFIVDAVADPTNLVGAGMIEDVLKVSSKVKNTGARINKVFKSPAEITKTGTISNAIQSPLSKEQEETFKWIQEQARFKKLPETKNKQALATLENFKTRINTPEGKRRLKDLGISEQKLLNNLKIVEDKTDFGYYRKDSGTVALHPNLPDISLTARHEIEHAVQDAYNQSKLKEASKFKLSDLWYDLFDSTARDKRYAKAQEDVLTSIDKSLGDLELRKKSTNPEWMSSSATKPRKEINVNDYRTLVKDKQLATDYFLTGSKGKEKSAYLGEVQQYMMNKGILPNTSYIEVTPEMVHDTFVGAMFDKTDGGSYLRLFDIIKPTPSNFKIIADNLNKMLSISAPIMATQLNKEDKQQGGLISKLGYKKNSPYKDSPFLEIDSNHITMDGVDQPLILIPEVGKPVIAKPNSGDYIFPNSQSVTEVPLSKLGGFLQKYKLGGCMECGGMVKAQEGGLLPGVKQNFEYLEKIKSKYNEGTPRENTDKWKLLKRFDNNDSLVQSPNTGEYLYRDSTSGKYRVIEDKKDVENLLELKSSKVSPKSKPLQPKKSDYNYNYKTPKEIQSQQQFLTDYISSPKYEERLRKEGFTNPKKEQDIRRSRVKSTPIEYVKSIGKRPGFISGVFTPDQKIKLESEYNPETFYPKSGFETIPIHEMYHASDDAGKRIHKNTKGKIKDLTITPKNSYEEYLTDPTEFIGRVVPLRYLLKQEGIYDSSKEDFTPTHLELLKNNQNIQKNQHYKDLIKSLKGGDKEKEQSLEWILNNIASTNPTLSNVAENGGKVQSFKNKWLK